MATRYGVDFARYAGYFPQSTADALAAAGQSFAIIQAQVGPFGQQAAYCLNAGMLVDPYFWPNYQQFWTGPLADLASRIALCANLPFQHGWLDVEDAVGIEAVTLDQRIARIAAYVEMIERGGLNAGIYTRRNFWQTYLANTREFAHLPMWEADYRLPPNPNAGYTIFGGWTDRAVYQFQGDTTLAGIGVDKNVLSDTFAAEWFGA